MTLINALFGLGGAGLMATGVYFVGPIRRLLTPKDSPPPVIPK